MTKRHVPIAFLVGMLALSPATAGAGGSSDCRLGQWGFSNQVSHHIPSEPGLQVRVRGTVGADGAGLHPATVVLGGITAAGTLRIEGPFG